MARTLAQDDHIARLIADHARDGLLLQDIRGRIEWANPAYLRMFGRSLSSIVGLNPLSFCMPPEERPSEETIAGFRYKPGDGIAERYEIIENIRSDGEKFWNQLSFGVVQLGPGEDNTKVIVICRDVTDQVATEQALRQAKIEIEHAATHDDLTGLANRKLLKSYLESTPVKRCLRHGRAGLLQMDVNHFKQINDRLGHNAGDAALIHVAEQLKRLAGDSGNMACRTGGDEFQLVCLDIDSKAWLLERADMLTDAIAEPFRFEGQDIRTSVAIGLAMATPGMDDGLELVKRADQALYQVKHNGRGKPVMYTASLGQSLKDRDQLVADLRVALKDGQMQMFFQPQLELAEDRLVGLEALIRWQHPTRGLLAPVDFLDAAEQNHVLDEIDSIAANEALDALSTLSDLGWTDLRMAINVAGQTLAASNYVGKLNWSIQSRNLAPDRICVEVQESMILSSVETEIAGALTDLHRMGVKIGLDDFGTGYAGLGQLSQFVIDYIKLDRSMVARLDQSERDRRIVRAIVALCRDLRTSVVAEGVETEKQLQVLRDCDCPVIQGYGLGRPMPFSALLPWLEGFAARTGPFRIPGPQTGKPVPLKQAG